MHLVPRRAKLSNCPMEIVYTEDCNSQAKGTIFMVEICYCWSKQLKQCLLLE